jgi:hypothetical protein
MERKKVPKADKRTAPVLKAPSLASTLSDMPAGEWFTVQFDPETRVVEKIFRAEPGERPA